MKLSEKTEFKMNFQERNLDLADYYDLKESKVSLEEERYCLI